MTTITVKLPSELDLRLQSVAKRKRTSKSAVIRELLEDGLHSKKVSGRQSCYDLAKDLCGVIKGTPRDMSANKRYLEGFGR